MAVAGTQCSATCVTALAVHV